MTREAIIFNISLELSNAFGMGFDEFLYIQRYVNMAYQAGLETYEEPDLNTKSVYSIDADSGEYLQTFQSIREASRKTGIPLTSIFHSIKKIIKRSGNGINWEYSKENQNC